MKPHDTAQGPLAGGSPGSIRQNGGSDVSTEQYPKWWRVLHALYRGLRLNRFMAEHSLHDHTLPSTISYLQSLGVVIERRDIDVPGFQNAPTRCKEYWLSTSSYERAAELLGLERADVDAGNEDAT